MSSKFVPTSRRLTRAQLKHMTKAERLARQPGKRRDRALAPLIEENRRQAREWNDLCDAIETSLDCARSFRRSDT